MQIDISDSDVQIKAAQFGFGTGEFQTMCKTWDWEAGVVINMKGMCCYKCICNVIFFML